MVRRAVYTALLGGYERLVEQPAAPGSGIDFYCLTDDPSVTSETWTVVRVEPRFPVDTVRSARRLKILGAPVVDSYDETLWIDNRVQLLADPNEILDEWLTDCDLALPRHSFREDVLDEFRAVVDSGFDDANRVYEQLIHYSRSRPEVLDLRPHWTGILARRRTEAVAAAMTQWFEEVTRYSRRDQLSFEMATETAGLRYRTVELDNLASDLHRWLDPERLGRTMAATTAALRDTLVPAQLVERRLRELATARGEQLAVAEAERDAAFEQGRDLFVAVSRRESAVAAADAARAEDGQARVVAEAAQAVAEAACAAAERALATAERDLDAVRATISWRVTRPLRAVRGITRR